MHAEKCMALAEDDAPVAPHSLSAAAQQDLFAAIETALFENRNPSSHDERLRFDISDADHASCWSAANTLNIRPADACSIGRQNSSSSLKKFDDSLGRSALIILGTLMLTLGVGFSGGWASHHYLGVKARTTGLVDPPVRNPVAAVTSVPKTDMLSRNPPFRQSQTTASLGRATNASPGLAKIPAVSGSVVKPVEQASSASRPDMVEPVSVRQPVPETGPTTIEGWMVRDVRGEAIVLQGPDGVRKVARGDMVPGVGRIDSVVRWGSRWIVSTTSGLIATP
jgi:hypothetical protein